MALLDFLFPKKCVICKRMGEYLCPNCFSQLSFDVSYTCLVCQRSSWNGMTHPKCRSTYSIDGYSSAVTYKRVAKRLLYQFKYKPYISDLQTVMTDLLYESLLQNEVFLQIIKSSPILIPIPLSNKKLRSRGYNQSEILAKQIGKRFGLKVLTCLKRIKETKPQYGLKREERARNIMDAFDMADGKWQMAYGEDKTAILVDDVVTTGATLKEAAKILKRNGFKRVYAVTFAKD